MLKLLTVAALAGAFVVPVNEVRQPPEAPPMVQPVALSGLHVYAVLCQLHNPELCIDYEIVPDDFGPVNSVGYCMKGGAIFAMEHPTITVGGIDYINKGVHCKGNPPTNEEIQAWVRAEKERLIRMEPQVK